MFLRISIAPHLWILKRVSIWYTEKKHDEKALNVAGKSLSTDCTSFEKRLIILPIGVWSKNSIGAWRMFFSKKLCVNRADLSVPTNNDNVATNVAKTVNYTIDKHIKVQDKKFGLNYTLRSFTVWIYIMSFCDDI